MPTKITALLKARREKLDITGEAAAKKLGLSVNYYRLIESGYPTHISDRVAALFIDKLGVPTSIKGMLPAHNAKVRGAARKAREASRRPSKGRKGTKARAAKPASPGDALKAAKATLAKTKKATS